MDLVTELVPGPPYVFGALLVILAILVAAFIPEVTAWVFKWACLGYIVVVALLMDPLQAPPGGGAFRKEECGEEGRGRRRGERVHRSDDSYNGSDSEDEYKLPLIKVHTSLSSLPISSPLYRKVTSYSTSA